MCVLSNCTQGVKYILQVYGTAPVSWNFSLDRSQHNLKLALAGFNAQPHGQTTQTAVPEGMLG